MLMSKLKGLTAVLLMLATVVAGGLAYHTQAREQRPKTEAPDAERARTGKTWQVRTTLRGHSGGVAGIAFTPDGRLLASSGEDKTVRLWDVAKDRSKAILKGHTEAVVDVAFSPDGKWLASASRDGTAKIWDVKAEKEAATLGGHARWVWSVAFSPDGKTLASASGKGPNTGPGEVKLWDAATGQEIAAANGHDGYVCYVVFSPDGKTLATTGYGDKTIKLWDIDGKQNLKERASLKGHTGTPMGLAFSPDGKMLASAGTSDETVRVWNAGPGKLQAIIRNPGMNVDSVAFSPDGKTLFAGCLQCDRKKNLTELSGVVKLWDSATLKERQVLRPDANDAGSLALSRDGKYLATGHTGLGKGKVAKGETAIQMDRNGVVILWELK